MKKKDFLIAAAVLTLAVFCWLIPRFFLISKGEMLQISIDGEIYGRYSLREDQEIVIGSTNVCRITSGKVTMTEAHCPDQLCIRQKAIDENGGTIVCLPNRVVLEIVGDGKEEVDVIAE